MLKQIPQNLIATPGEHWSLGLVHRRPNKTVSVSRAPPSRDSGIPNGVSRLHSRRKTTQYFSVPSNHIRDSGQERQDSLQHPMPQNNINVSLSESRTVSWDQNDDKTEFPGFIGPIIKANNTILLQTISIPLITKNESVEDLDILLDSGSDRNFILNSGLDKLETKHIAVEKLTYGSFGGNVT